MTKLPYIEPSVIERPRVIVVLTMLDGNLVRTRRFQNPTYIGDPINAVKIFSDKGADELVLLEISGRQFNSQRETLIRDIASEALMPISYGGGIRNLQQIRSVIRCGFEKVVLNTALHENLSLASSAAEEFGSQAIIGSLEIGSGWFRKEELRTQCGKNLIDLRPVEWAKRCEQAGCGELLVTSIDKDGSMLGYDIESLKKVVEAVKIPVIAMGGAGSIKDFGLAIKAGASAVAAGSMFVFHGTRRAVLITYPQNFSF